MNPDNVVLLRMKMLKSKKKSNYVSVSCNLWPIFSFVSFQHFTFPYFKECDVKKVSQKDEMKILVFVYKLSGCGFEFRCSHLGGRFQKEGYSYFFGLIAFWKRISFKCGDHLSKSKINESELADLLVIATER